jgi:hypothetical protein
LMMAKLCFNGWRFMFSLIFFVVNIVVIELQWIILHKNGLEPKFYLYVISTNFFLFFS